MQDTPTIAFLQNRVAYIRDETAYQKLFYYFHPRLFRFCIKMLKVPEVAEEIVSDIMLKLWLMDSKLAYIDDLKLYLFKAAKNACLTHLTRQKRQIISLEAPEENTLTDTDHTPETQMLTTEAAQELERAVASLPPQCQMVFRLIREEGFSHRQVVQTLEISQNTIETHMRIALKRIKTQLDRYLNEKK